MDMNSDKNTHIRYMNSELGNICSNPDRTERSNILDNNGTHISSRETKLRTWHCYYGNQDMS